jgi:hypothetical protein
LYYVAAPVDLTKSDFWDIICLSIWEVRFWLWQFYLVVWVTYRMDRNQFHHLHREILSRTLLKHTYNYSIPVSFSWQYYILDVNNSTRIGSIWRLYGFMSF